MKITTWDDFEKEMVEKYGPLPVMTEENFRELIEDDIQTLRERINAIKADFELASKRLTIALLGCCVMVILGYTLIKMGVIN